MVWSQTTYVNFSILQTKGTPLQMQILIYRAPQQLDMENTPLGSSDRQRPLLNNFSWNIDQKERFSFSYWGRVHQL